MSGKKAEVLIVLPLLERFVAFLQDLYRIHYAPEGPKQAVLAQCREFPIRAVVTNGSIGFTEAQMAQLPQLGLICCFGAGYECNKWGQCKIFEIRIAGFSGKVTLTAI